MQSFSRRLKVFWAASGGGQQIKKGYCSPLFCSHEASFGVVCPDLGPPTQERCRAVGEDPEKDHEDDLRAEAPLLWRKVDRVRFAQHGEEKALERPCNLAAFQYFKGTYKQ